MCKPKFVTFKDTFNDKHVMNINNIRGLYTYTKPSDSTVVGYFVDSIAISQETFDYLRIELTNDVII